MAPGCPDSNSSHALTLDDMISQLQTPTSSVTNLTQQMTIINSCVDLLASKFQQLSNDISSLLISIQYASTVHPHTSKPLEVAPKVPGPAISPKAPLSYIIHLPPAIPRQVRNIIRNIESQGCEILETQVLNNCFHSTSFEAYTLEGTNTTIEEPHGDILDLVIKKELEESSFSLLEDIRVSSKTDLI